MPIQVVEIGIMVVGLTTALFLSFPSLSTFICLWIKNHIPDCPSYEARNGVAGPRDVTHMNQETIAYFDRLTAMPEEE